MPSKAANKVFIVVDAGGEILEDLPNVHGAHASLASAKSQCTAVANEMVESEVEKEIHVKSQRPELIHNEVFGVDVVDDKDMVVNTFRVIELVMTGGTVTVSEAKAPAASKAKTATTANKGSKRAAPVKETNDTDEDDDEDGPPAAKKSKPKKEKAVIRAEAAASLATKENLPQGSETSLAGRKIMITGTLEGVTRNEAEQLIEQHGGIMVKALSAKPDLVCVASKAGPKKIAEIEKKGIDTVSQAELWAIIENAAESD